MLQRKIRAWTGLVSLCLLALAPLAAHSHATGESYIFLTLRGDAIEVRVEITAAD